MQRQHSLPILLSAALLLAIFSLPLSAQQVVGKIAGTVTGSETGGRLVGVNVVVEGTQMGAASDASGYFFILNIPPGRYTVKASMLGYEPMTITDVIVSVNRTSELEFNLSETVLILPEGITVTAERPLIQKDLTSKVFTYTSEDIEEMPVADMTKLLATQSNISVLTHTPYQKRGYEARGVDDIRMRGGRNNEMGLFIDGMKVGNPLFGGFGTRVNNNAINQMTVAAGGFSAEYGNALSGFVNVSTREGGNRFAGQVEYSSSVPFGLTGLASQRMNARKLHNVELSISGPIPEVSFLTFFASSQISTQDAEIYQFDDVIWDEHRDIDGDGVPDVPTSMELVLDYIEDGSIDIMEVSDWKKVTTPLDIAGVSGRFINPFDMHKGWRGFGWDNGFDVFLKLTARISPTMKLTLSGLQQQDYSHRTLRNAVHTIRLPVEMYHIDPNRDWEVNKSGMGGRNVNFTRSDRVAVIWNHSVGPATFYTIRAQRFWQQRQTRILRNIDDKYSSSNLLGISYTNPFSPDFENNIKPKEEYDFNSTFGLDDPFEDYFRMRGDRTYFEGDASSTWDFRSDVTSQLNRENLVKMGVQLIYYDIDREDYQSSARLDPDPTIYRTFPIEGAIYVTDKIEFNHFVVNVGGRADYSRSRGRMWVDPLDPLGEQDPTTPELEYVGWTDEEATWKFSPRVGMAYPLTDRSVLHFNFGHFYQNPNYRDRYRMFGDLNRENAMIQGSLIGNPNLEHEKSIQYELGVQHQLTDVLAVNVTLWTKETTNQVGSVRVPAYSDPGNDNPFTYSVFVNNNFGSARGIDLTATKRYSHYFSGTLNYTYSRALVLEPTSWDGYWARETKETLPKRESIADWDQPHVLRANINFSIPRNSGPSFFGSKLLGDVGINLIYYAESGRPFTPTAAEGQLEEKNSQRWPSWHQIDFRAYKNFRIMGLEYGLFLQVENLLDRKNVQDGYTSTGDPEVSRNLYASRSATRMDAINTNNYGPRRMAIFGLRVRW